MKRIVLFGLSVFLFLNSNAQLSSFLDVPKDTSVYWPGIVSGQDLFRVKDSFGITSPSYFRIFTQRFQLYSLNLRFANGGTPTNIVWADDSGIVKKSPLSSLNTTIRSAVSNGTGIGYNSGTGVFTNTAPDQTVAFTN